ncbi:MAG TPA: ATP-binding protein [Verrucomicrobiales bacterium]|nr:ATP-binding protein [Verrucomicrobiales bacterium]
MLIEFKIANFRSIREDQALSFVADSPTKELPQNVMDTPIPGLRGRRLLKAAAIYGANASGKSNVLAALRYVIWFVRNSATGIRPDGGTGTEPFKLDPQCAELPSKFELHAMVNGVRMLYGLELTRHRVVSEYLVAYPKGHARVWFERDWDDKAAGYKWSKSSEHFHHDKDLRSKVRENASFLSVAAQFNHGPSLTMWEWFGSAFHLIDTSRGDEIESMAELLGNAQWRTTAVEILNRADLGILDARVAKRERPPRGPALWPERFVMPDPDEDSGDVIVRPGERNVRVMFPIIFDYKDDSTAEWAALRKWLTSTSSVPQLLHQGRNGASVPMDFTKEESEGTRRLLAILARYLRGFGRARLMMIDEIETSLHPLLVREIIGLFASLHLPEASGYPQLLFTTHNPLLLDQTLLRRDQIWFTEKDREGATRLYPLTDYKPRNDEALVKGYLAGRYGGIPFIPEGLLAP